MLTITANVLECIKNSVKHSSVEQGFALGCASCLERIDVCEQIHAVQAGLYFYSPNTKEATKIVKEWAQQKICFCGFIHSHRTDKSDFSEADLLFAEKLLSSFRMPYLWFGLVVITDQKKELLFYKLYSIDGEMVLNPVRFYVEENHICG